MLDRLHAKGNTSDLRRKAKSVVVTEEGVKQSRALFPKYFGKKLTHGSAVGFEAMLEGPRHVLALANPF